MYSEKHKKPYFVNDETKQTSWVDPRDALWKKKNWQDCDPFSNETPFGWEIQFDDLCGIYFINHLEERNMLDDPRTNVFYYQVQELNRFIQNDCIVILQIKKKSLDEKIEYYMQKKIKYDKKKFLTSRKNKLECLFTEIQGLKQEWEALQQTLVDIEEIGTKLQQDNRDQLIAQRQCQQTIDQTKIKLNQMRKVEEKLKHDLAIISTTQVELQGKEPDEIQQCLLQVLKETEPQQLQNILNKNYPRAKELDQWFLVKKQWFKGDRVLPSTDIVDDVYLTEKYNKNGVTRVERELELLQIQKKVQALNRRNLQLESIIELARKEIENFLLFPDWKSTFPWVSLIQDYQILIQKEAPLQLKLQSIAKDEQTLSGISLRDKVKL